MQRPLQALFRFPAPPRFFTGYVDRPVHRLPAHRAAGDKLTGYAGHRDTAAANFS